MSANLDIVEGIAARGVIINGAPHDVLDLTAEECLVDLTTIGIPGLVDICARIVPTVPREDLLKLSPRKLGYLYSIGAGAISRVAELFPNEPSPAPQPVSG